MTATRDLIDRLLLETFECRHSDGLIYGALHGLVPQGTFVFGDRFQYRHPTLVHPNGPASLYVPEDRVPAYTACVTTALSLVPEGLSPSVGQNVHHKHWYSHILVLSEAGEPVTVADANAPTAALAVCIAALRARSIAEPLRIAGEAAE